MFSPRTTRSSRTLSGLLLSALLPALLPALTPALSLAMPAAAAAHPRYTVHIVGVAGSSATGINAGGAVVGNYPSDESGTRAFVNTGGGPVDFGTLGGATTASGINDGGEIVGTSINGDGFERAYRYSGGTLTDLGTLGGNLSGASAINNRGDVVGAAQLGPSGALDSRAFLLRGGASMQDLGRFDVPDPEGSSAAMGLNERRQVVGGSVLGPYTPPESAYHAFLYACEEMRDLGTLGGQYSLAYAINERGVVVGEASTLDLHHNRAFLWRNGTMYNLGVLPGGDFSTARDINSRNQVVGHAFGGDTGARWQRAFLVHAGTMRAINGLVPAGSGWDIREANAINNASQIAATGCKAGVCYALRLDPAP